MVAALMRAACLDSPRRCMGRLDEAHPYQIVRSQVVRGMSILRNGLFQHRARALVEVEVHKKVRNSDATPRVGRLPHPIVRFLSNSRCCGTLAKPYPQGIALRHVRLVIIQIAKQYRFVGQFLELLLTVRADLAQLDARLAYG